MKCEIPNFQVFSANDEVYLGGFSMGAGAAIGSNYNVMAPRFIRITQLYSEGEMHQARAEQSEANKRIEALLKVGVITGIKHLLTVMGIDCGSAASLRTDYARKRKDVGKSVFRLA